jgi:hypothetical protein
MLEVLGEDHLFEGPYVVDLEGTDPDLRTGLRFPLLCPTHYGFEPFLLQNGKGFSDKIVGGCSDKASPFSPTPASHLQLPI